MDCIWKITALYLAYYKWRRFLAAAVVYVARPGTASGGALLPLKILSPSSIPNSPHLALTALYSSHGQKRCAVSACRGYPGPMSNSNSFGMMAELPTFPCRDDFVVEIGDAAPKSCLPSMAMRTITAAGGLLPTGKTATETTTFNESPLWLTRPRRRIQKRRFSRRLRLHTSRTTAVSGTCLLPPPAEGSSRQSQDKIGRSIQVVIKVISAPARFLGSWRVLFCGEVVAYKSSW